MVHYILRDTLERIPIFGRLAPSFHLAIFPHLKPLSVQKGELIFAKVPTSASGQRRRGQRRRGQRRGSADGVRCGCAQGAVSGTLCALGAPPAFAGARNSRFA